MSTNKAETNRAKLTNEAYELHKLGFGGVAAPKSPLLAQNEVDAMLGGLDITGLETLTAVKALNSKIDLKPSTEPSQRTMAAPVVEQKAAPEPVSEAQPQLAAASTEEGHSFSHFFQSRDEQPVSSTRSSSIEMFA